MNLASTPQNQKISWAWKFVFAQDHVPVTLNSEYPSETKIKSLITKQPRQSDLRFSPEAYILGEGYTFSLCPIEIFKISIHFPARDFAPD